MRTFQLWPWALTVVLASGCSLHAVDDESDAVLLGQSAGHGDTQHAAAPPSGAFQPPPPSPGYTRLVPPVMKNIAPNANTMFCQIIQAPLDHDVDVLDVRGHQSFGGHHVVAYATTAPSPVGTSRECTDEDQLTMGSFLGGVGGEAGGAVNLPEGVAFRLPKGSAIMVSTHFINNTDAAFDGQAVIDFKFAEPSSDRLVAAMFNNANLNFRVPAGATHEAVAECVLQREMRFILFSNHMHERGLKAKTEVVRADGRVELIHEDRHWTPELEFRADFSKWTLEKPLILVPGDRVRTQCTWENPTSADLAFPNEMCIGIGFFLASRSTNPVCIGGAWFER